MTFASYPMPRVISIRVTILFIIPVRRDNLLHCPHLDGTALPGVEKEKQPFSEADGDGQGSFFTTAGTNQDHPETELYPEHYQYKQKYILTSVKSGLMIIDQHKAHIRILFDKYLEQIRDRKGVTQRVLFPEILELSAAETATLPSLMNDLEALGFELSPLGNYTFAVQGVPSEIDNVDASLLITYNYWEKAWKLKGDVEGRIQEAMALSFAGITAIPYGRILTSEEMFTKPSVSFLRTKTNTHLLRLTGKKFVSLISECRPGKKMH